jgi:hypothetical protein
MNDLFNGTRGMRTLFDELSATKAQTILEYFKVALENQA